MEQRDTAFGDFSAAKRRLAEQAADRYQRVGLRARGTLGDSGRPAGRNDDLGPATGARRRAACRPCSISASRVSAAGVARPCPNPAQPRVDVGDDGAVLVVVHKEVDAFAGHHVGELRAAEAGVEQQDTCTALAGRVNRFQETSVVTRQDGDAGTRAKPAPAPLVRQRVRPVVQIAETQRPTLVDQRHPLGVSSGGDHRRRPQQAVAVEPA